ncbi:MAG: hypothetical protein AABX01_04670 [Candidatus Micrarchaeota archaeon]
MVLDASTYNLVLTPESALSMIQKEIAHRGWKKFEVEEVRLIYTPFYMFSFDVKAEGGAPPITGKAAINAYNGDISDLIPYIIDRPLTKTKNPSEGGEIEETAISMAEAKEATKDKIAAQTGLKRESVSVSAFVKVYIPFFRIWLEAAHQPIKVDVDALMGTPLGLEGLHEREKTWGEATSETLSRLKTPQGWVDLSGKLIGSLTGGGGGGHVGGDHGRSDGHGDGGQGGGAGGIAGTGFQSRWLILIVAIGALAYFAFLQPSSGIKCTGEITQYKNECMLSGICTYSLKNNAELPVGEIKQVFVKDGKDTLFDTYTNVVFESTQEPFEVTFEPKGKECRQYTWGYS